MSQSSIPDLVETGRLDRETLIRAVQDLFLEKLNIRIASTNQDLFQTFAEKYQAGKVADLEAGLKALDRQIDSQIAQDTGGGAP